MKSASNYSFSRAPQVSVPRSSFKRDRSYKTAFDSGYLIPFFSDEVYPGDTFNVNTTAFARLATPILPFMDNIYLDFFFFFVPYRLIWTNWNRMLGEQDNPDDSTDFLTPILCTSVLDGGTWHKDKNIKTIKSGSLFDYLGFPVGSFGLSDWNAEDPTSPATDGLEINAFLPRAYNKVWNDHFRDENLQDSVPEYKDDGPDSITDGSYTLLRRGKRKDYFTSCLPWPQKGPGAQIAVNGSGVIPIYGDGQPLALHNFAIQDSDPTRLGVLGTQGTSSGLTRPYTAFGFWDHELVPMGIGSFDASIPQTSPLGVATEAQLQSGSFSDSNLLSSGLQAKLSDVLSAISINDLRMAYQLQRLMEKDARGGTRAPEIILSHFGVVCPDFRLQRSEFLGGGQIPVQVHQVTQTSATDATSPQGNTAAFGVASGRVGFSKSFVEHGVVLGLVSARCDLNYQQGIHRSWTRRGKYDYYWPALAHLGEQAVLNKEIYATGDLAQDNAAFGYQERWAELRYGVNQITGILRSGVNGSLDVWHLAQHFDSLPTLNAQFIEDNPPVDRVIAVPSQPQFIFDSLTQCNCVRPMPMYSIPGWVDHF